MNGGSATGQGEVPSLLTSATGHPEQGCGGDTMGANLGEAEGKQMERARLAAKGYQEPDLKDGNVDIAGFVSRRSSHLQLIPLGPLET